MTNPIFAVANARIFIGTTVPAADESDFLADTYVEVLHTESFGDFGDTATDIPFTGLGDDRTQHLKGSVDASVVALQVARDDTDPGQLAMIAAFGTKTDYNFKIVWANNVTAMGAGGLTFFRGKVMSRQFVNGTGPNNVAKQTLSIGINSAQIQVPPT